MAESSQIAVSRQFSISANQFAGTGRVAESSQTAIPEAAVTMTAEVEDAEWDSLAIKGAELVSRMKNGPPGETPWKYEQLRGQGWIQEDYNGHWKPFLRGFEPRVNLTSTLTLLNVSDKDKYVGGRNSYQSLKLDRDEVMGEKKDLVHGIPNYGNLENSFNPEDGVIICHLNFKARSPLYDHERRKDTEVPVPQLNNWSDLIFLQWEHFAEQSKCNVRNLRYVFRSRINNVPTLMVINRALKAQTGTTEAQKWPGHTFGTESVEGRALLATQNAKGVARGMIDRQDKYSGMVVEAIQVFLDDPPPSSPFPPAKCMLIRIVDTKSKQQVAKAPVTKQKVDVADKKPSKATKAKATKAMKSTKEKVKKGIKEGVNERCIGMSG